MHNLDRGSASSVCLCGFLVGMVSAWLVVVGQDDKAMTFQILLDAFRQAVTDATKAECGDVYVAKAINVLLALGPQNFIGDQLGIERVDCRTHVRD